MHEFMKGSISSLYRFKHHQTLEPRKRDFWRNVETTDHDISFGYWDETIIWTFSLKQHQPLLSPTKGESSNRNGKKQKTLFREKPLSFTQKFGFGKRTTLHMFRNYDKEA